MSSLLALLGASLLLFVAAIATNEEILSDVSARQGITRL